MKKLNKMFYGLRSFTALWSTQSLSALGSSMTGFGLIIWSYEQQGSALTTALLSVCSYAPYVLFSIFAGVLSDKWNKKGIMLICDSVAAITTLIVWFLFYTQQLEIWQLYLINAISGTMNAVQQPASEIATSLLVPKEQYQKVSGMKSFSNSLVTILTPVIATSVLAFAGMNVVFLFDMASFAAAFITLAFWIKIPVSVTPHKEQETSLLESTKEVFSYLRINKGILYLILFFAVINLVASIYEAALPAMLLSREGGGIKALGTVNFFVGAASIAGSMITAMTPTPKSRVRIIFNALLISMSTENFLLAFGRNLPVWCLGAVLGWLMIPLMNANMDVILRSKIPIEIQSRVYSARNTLQFFTIPLGYLIGGISVDYIFEPFMEGQVYNSMIGSLFGTGKGSGAALLYFILGIAGVTVCLYFRRNKHIWSLEKE